MNNTEVKNSREALIEAGRRLFIEKGYEAVSTRELAEAAGVNLGAIQYHFGSKGRLFLEIVLRMMEGSGHTGILSLLDGEIESKHDAALRLTKYIFAFLSYLLHSEGPQPCHMMFREIFSPVAQDKELFEALTASVVNDFIKPTDDVLLVILKHLKPEADEEELWLTAHSIVGQCAFYVTHRPFAERLRGCDFASQEMYGKIAAHITRFTLGNLNCDDRLTETVIKEVRESGLFGKKKQERKK